MLGVVAHDTGWPIPVGGAQSLTDALVSDIEAHGGVVTRGQRIHKFAELGASRLKFFDTSTAAMGRVVGSAFPDRYRRVLNRQHVSPGAFKLDFALSSPVPWAARELHQVPVVHVGGIAEEILRSEFEVAAGKRSEKPFVLLIKPTVVVDTRAEKGVPIVWAYCHKPNGSPVDMSERIIVQIERFAPGFRETILHTVTSPLAVLEQESSNYVGGDIGAASMTFAQIVARPIASRAPWRTPARGVYLCSSAASPGVGAHGMAGYGAARGALKEIFGLGVPELA